VNDDAPMVPLPYRVLERRRETTDTATLTMAPVRRPLPAFRPGQFTMLYRHGVGEIAISISGPPSTGDGLLIQTIRDVGAVSRSLHDAEPGDLVGARGPFGNSWGLEQADGLDLVLVAGGVGLAPLRPVLLAAAARRAAYGRVVLIAGARRPEEFLYRDQLAAWSDTESLRVELTVDRPADGWTGQVGFVTEPLRRLPLDPDRTAAFLCGPEPMMRFSAQILIAHGVPAERVMVSLERNMKCGVGLCGHCQLGPVLLCRDGPVLDYARARPLMDTLEL